MEAEEMYNRIDEVITKNWGQELAETLYHRICEIVWYPGPDGRKDKEAVRNLYEEYKDEIEAAI